MLRTTGPFHEMQSKFKTPSSQLNQAIEHAYQFLKQDLNHQFGFQSLWEKDRWQGSEATKSHENFSTLLIANLLGHRPQANAIRDHLIRILKNNHKGGFAKFFREQSPVPFDIHSSCLCLEFLLEYGGISNIEAMQAVDQIIANTNEAGVISLYLSPKDERLKEVTDPVACLNALYLLNLVGRSDECEPTYRFVQNYLISRRYLAGTRYYPGAESFLFFLTRLVAHFPFLKLQWAFELKRAIHDSMQGSQQGLELAMQIYTGTHLGMSCQHEVKLLLSLQASDGGWPSEMLLEDGQGRPLLGSRALTTAFAVFALESFELAY